MKTFPQVREHSRAEATIDAFFFDFASIWQSDASDRSLFDLWLHVIDHCSRLVEAVRKERPREVADDLADTFVWFLSFVAHMHASRNAVDEVFKITTLPSDLIWNKYPGICPACLDYRITSKLKAHTGNAARKELAKRHDSILRELVKEEEVRGKLAICECLSRIAFAEERHAAHSAIVFELDKLRLAYAREMDRQGKKLSRLSELEDMFGTVFQNAYTVYPLPNIAFHLLEEVGEVSRAMKDCYTFDKDREPYDKATFAARVQKLEEEIADVFSWMFAVLLKIRRVHFADAQQYFQQVLPSKGPILVGLDFARCIDMTEIIWAKYGTLESGESRSTLFCPGCGCAPCECRRALRIRWSRAAARRTNRQRG